MGVGVFCVGVCVCTSGSKTSDQKGDLRVQIEEGASAVHASNAGAITKVCLLRMLVYVS